MTSSHGVEWHGSCLHEEYEALGEAAVVSPSGGSRELLAAALEGSHQSLRALLQRLGSAESGDLPSQERESLLAAMDPLWEDLQVSDEGRSRVVPENAVEFATALLTYRDKAIVVIHGLTEHDRLLQALWHLESDGPGSSKAQANLLARLSQIDEALLKLLAAWNRRYADGPPYEDTHTANQTGKPMVFLWRGADAAAQVQKDVEALLSRPTTGLEGGPSWRRRRGDPTPSNCSQRAALNDCRALRAVLRSAVGGGDGLSGANSTMSSKTDLGQSWRGGFAA